MGGVSANIGRSSFPPSSSWFHTADLVHWIIEEHVVNKTQWQWISTFIFFLNHLPVSSFLIEYFAVVEISSFILKLRMSGQFTILVSVLFWVIFQNNNCKTLLQSTSSTCNNTHLLIIFNKLAVHLHLFPLLFWQNSFIYLFLNSDESISEAKREAIKFHSLYLLPLKVSLLPFTASSNVQHLSLHGMLSPRRATMCLCRSPHRGYLHLLQELLSPFIPQHKHEI